MSTDQLSAIKRQNYNMVWKQGLKKERQALSKARFNKMSNLIVAELPAAIREVDSEPTATIYENQSLDNRSRGPSTDR